MAVTRQRYCHMGFWGLAMLGRLRPAGGDQPGNAWMSSRDRGLPGCNSPASVQRVCWHRCRASPNRAVSCECSWLETVGSNLNRQPSGLRVQPRVSDLPGHRGEFISGSVQSWSKWQVRRAPRGQARTHLPNAAVPKGGRRTAAALHHRDTHGCAPRTEDLLAEATTPARYSWRGVGLGIRPGTWNGRHPAAPEATTAGIFRSAPRGRVRELGLHVLRM